MPEPLIHFIIPFILLVMFGFNMKKATFFSLFALLPDLDVLFHIHRSFSHSIFFLFLFAVPAIVLTSKFYKNYRGDVIIISLVILSHIFMDCFDNYTPVFWPLYNESILIVAELTTNMNNVMDLNFIFNVTVKPIAFYKTTNLDTAIFSSLGFAVSLIFVICIILKHYYSVKPPATQP